MLSVFKRLLGRDTGESAPDHPPGKLRVLLRRRRAGLLARLRDQHQDLLTLFGELELASGRNDPGGCQSVLGRFAQALEDHLTLEDRQLYGYLSRQHRFAPDLAQRIAMMSTDMMHVATILHRFTAKYSSAGMTLADLAGLRQDLPAVGEVLAHRIHEEESVLYPLYAPPAD